MSSTGASSPTASAAGSQRRRRSSSGDESGGGSPKRARSTVTMSQRENTQHGPDWNFCAWQTMRGRIEPGFFMPPPECERLLSDDTGILHPYVFFQPMANVDVPCHLATMLEAASAVASILQSGNVDLSGWMLQGVPGVTLAVETHGTTTPQLRVYDKRMPFVRACMQVVTIERAEELPHDADPQLVRACKFVVLTVVAPVVFNVRKAMMDVMSGTVHALKGRPKQLRPEEEKARNAAMMEAIEWFKLQAMQAGGMDDVAGFRRGQDSCSEHFIGAEFAVWLALPCAMRHMLRISAQRTGAEELHVRGGVRGDVEWEGYECTGVLEDYYRRGVWECKQRKVMIEFSQLTKKQRNDEANTPVLPSPPGIRFQRVYAEDDAHSPEWLGIDVTPTTFIVSVMHVGVILERAKHSGTRARRHEWAMPASVARIARGDSRYLCGIDPDLVSDIMHREQPVDFAAALRIIGGTIEEAHVRMLNKSLLYAYNNIIKAVHQQPPEERVELWYRLVQSNVETVLHNIKDELYYRSPEGKGSVEICETHLGGMRTRCAEAYARWLTNHRDHSISAKRYEVAQCAPLSVRQGRLLFEFGVMSAYMQHKGLTGSGAHVFVLIRNNLFFGILDFSNHAIEAAAEAVGGPIFLCNGGGGYVYNVEGKDRPGEVFPDLNKAKGIGANYSVSLALELLMASYYGLCVDLGVYSETTGVTDTAVIMDTSVTIIDGRVDPTVRRHTVPYRLLATEMTFGGSMDRVLSVLSTMIPRGREDGTARARQFTQEPGKGSGRQSVCVLQVTHVSVMILCSNRVTWDQMERGDAIAQVSRTVTSTPPAIVAHGSTQGEFRGDREALRSVFFDGMLLARLVAFAQREGAVGVFKSMAPVQAAIADLFNAQMNASKMLDHSLIASNMIARITRGAEARAVCQTVILTAGMQLTPHETPPPPFAAGEEPDVIDASIQHVDCVSKAVVDCKFNPIALEVVPSMLADQLEQRLFTAVIGFMTTVCVELEVPYVPPPTLVHWFATGRFPEDRRSALDDPLRVRAWYNGFQNAARTWSAGQLWLSRNGVWGDDAAVGGGGGFNFHNPNGAHGGGTFVPSILQVKDFSREFTDASFCQGIATQFMAKYKAELFDRYYLCTKQVAAMLEHALDISLTMHEGFFHRLRCFHSVDALLAGVDIQVPAQFAYAPPGRSR